MNNWKRIGVALALAGAMEMPMAGNGYAVEDMDRLYVINSLGENLTMIDRAGDSVVTNLMPLGGCPNRIRAHNGFLLVVNSCTDDLMLISQATHTVVQTTNFPSGDNPWDVAVIDDSLCAVSMLIANEVAIVNYVAGAERRRFTVGVSPEGLLYHGGRLWVANSAFDFGTFEYGLGTVSVSNTALTAIETTVNVGTNPQLFAVGGDGNIHLMCTGNYFDRFGIIYVFDPVTRVVTDSIAIGNFPGDLVVGQEGNGYLAGGGFVDSGFVYRYDTDSHAVLNGPANPWKTARGVLSVSPRLEGGVFALAFSGDTVAELSLSGELERAWQVGDGPAYATYVTNRLPGDINQDGIHNIQDVVGVVGLAFRAEPSPVRPPAGDVNADCVYSVIDVVMIVNHVFRGGAALYWGCAE